MKGKQKIVVKNHRVTYTIELERNITIIRGDSATGKTSLIRSLAAYEELQEKSGVSVISGKPCHILRGKDWEEQLGKWDESIVFSDEGNAFISSEAFAAAIRETGHYYVLITRENLYQLPYSVNAVLEMKKSTSRFKHTYNRTYPYYHLVPQVRERLRTLDVILTEDTNSGHDWFSVLAGTYGLRCVSAGGKSAILRLLAEGDGARTLVFGDGAAFGAEMENVYQYTLLHPDEVLLYLPESFEWIILKAGLVQDKRVKDILADPSTYIESRDYLSWERYFTALLREETKETSFAYHKRKLAPYYLRDDNVEKILQVIENG